ncbi:MAG TPA: OsmC family protein [Thermoanaerobaculia bacterium]|nr:OsmC family protein [Thermoanaerobaculia bacterium]
MMKMTFPGGLAVNAEYKGMTIRTDQPVGYGGGGTAPAPFDLFLASIGTCAGFYALRFCQERGIATAGLGLTLATELDPGTKRIGTMRLELQLPEGFPEKYRNAILRSVDQCTVKRHLVDPPRFELGVAAPTLAMVEA